MKTSIPLVLVTFALVCFALSPKAEAVSPPPDGGYPGGNTAEGQSALLGLTTGTYNTAVGFLALSINPDADFNTAIGAGTLLANSADQNTATGAGALLSNTTGTGNTANGAFALFNNTTGDTNTATGVGALRTNSTGSDNTAIGAGALDGSAAGNFNTAIGSQALFINSGSTNTGIGAGALYINSADGNTATGYHALYSNSNGAGNAAYGSQALNSNTTGTTNTAIGSGALQNNSTGTGNVALGILAGAELTTGDGNIDIGNEGVAGEANTLRIGQTILTTFIAGISGVNEGGTISAVYINTDGQLGTQPPPSSRRFKKEIEPMNSASESILALKPVTFHYKSDKTGTPQFGLIAEEVAEANPDLVVHDENGEIYTVRYDAVNAMLLNEFLKEHRKNEEQEKTIAELKSGTTALAAMVKEQAAQIQKVSAQLAAASPSRGGLEASEAAPQVVNNDQ